MHPSTILAQGREILEPPLLAAGFRFEPGIADVGSGGAFARGSFVRSADLGPGLQFEHRLEFSVRESLGEVVYRVASPESVATIAHEDLMRVTGGRGEYPGFSSDTLDGFRHLRSDLEKRGKVFLRPMAEDFFAFVERAQRTPRPGGLAALELVHKAP